MKNRHVKWVLTDVYKEKTWRRIRKYGKWRRHSSFPPDSHKRICESGLGG
jgi:hypothetical protein